MKERKIKIEGLRVDNIDSLKKEIFDQLRIKSNIQDFDNCMDLYFKQNCDEVIILIWYNYDISLRKMRDKLTDAISKEFKLSQGNAMIFDAVNKPLDKNEQLEFKKATKKLESLKKEISDLFSNLNIKVEYR